MGNFDRDNRSGRGRSFNRQGFGNRGSERPEMHKAICDRCNKECEVPFRPTGGKPIFCSSCFENNRGSQRSTNFEDRRMFDARCDECGNNCKVPFQPTGGKPVYCSNCFGDKNDNRVRNTEQPQYKEQFESLNTKLDRILKIITPEISMKIEDQKPEKKIKAKKATSIKKK